MGYGLTHSPGNSRGCGSRVLFRPWRPRRPRSAAAWLSSEGRGNHLKLIRVLLFISDLIRAPTGGEGLLKPRPLALDVESHLSLGHGGNVEQKPPTLSHRKQTR